jgi:putative ATPase
VRLASGDARRALTVLEAAAGAAANTEIDTAALDAAADRALVRYDRAGDQHYDVISAFIKSVRGSDVDAALHYLARMIEAGEDPRFIARRLIILASEDIGLADPTALTTAVAAAQAVQLVGLPEGRLALGQAVIALSLAPKSNAVIVAVDEAAADVRAGLAGEVPLHLRDAHAKGSERLGHGRGYVYPHDEDDGIARQTYLPSRLSEAAYYRPSRFGAEARLRELTDSLGRLLGRGPHPASDDGPRTRRDAE